MKDYAVALFYMSTSMISQTMANTTTDHQMFVVNANSSDEALGMAISEYRKKHQGKFLFSWVVSELLKSDKNDERIATQQELNSSNVD